MKSFILFILFLINSAVSYGQEKAFFKSMDCNPCENCFAFSDVTLAPQERELLSTFLFFSLIDEYECNVDLDLLYYVPNLDKIITSIYLNGVDFLPSAFGEYYFDDHKIEILFDIKDSIILYKVTDLLLEEKKGDGLMALWDILDIEQLSNFEEYFCYVVKSQNFFLMADLVAVMHNIKEVEKRNILLKEMKKLSSFSDDYEPFAKFLKGKEQFSFSEYRELLYSR